MEKINHSGFTLIELLAVIVILGVIMIIAVPSVASNITNSKKDSFVTSAKAYTDSVIRSSVSEEFPLPVGLDEVTIVSIDMIELEKGSDKTSFGGTWIKNKSYVAIINAKDANDPKYEYYFAGQDSKNNAIALTEYNSIKRTSVIKNAKNTMEVTIQSLAGDRNGVEEIHDIISGLPKKTTNPWKATIFTNQ